MYLKGRSIWISLGPDKKMRNIGLMSPETIRYGEQLLAKKTSANTVEIIAAMMELKKSEVSPGSFKQYRSTQKFCQKHFRLIELEKINSDSRINTWFSKDIMAPCSGEKYWNEWIDTISN